MLGAIPRSPALRSADMENKHSFRHKKTPGGRCQMQRKFLAGLESSKEVLRLGQAKSTSRINRAAFMLLYSTIAGVAQNAPITTPKPESQNCAALMQLNLENAPGGPALITSARLVDIPASGLEQWPV